MKNKIKILCSLISLLTIIFLAVGCGGEAEPVGSVPSSTLSSTIPSVGDTGIEDNPVIEPTNIYKNGGVVMIEPEYFECGHREDTCAKIPLVALLRELGAEIVWETDTVARIQIDDNVLILDTVQRTIKEEGREISFLDRPAPGGGLSNVCICMEGVGEDFCISFGLCRFYYAESVIPAKGEFEEDKIAFVPKGIERGLHINGVHFANATFVAEDTEWYWDLYSFSITDVLKGCGFDIKETGENQVVASKNNCEYIIDFENMTFTKKGTEENLLANTENRETYRCNLQQTEGEAILMVDFDTIKSIMCKIDAPIFVRSLYSNNSCIYIWSDYGNPTKQ